MRKNLLLLIMFCLIATIGAKATATRSGSTLTTTSAGDVKDCYNTNKNILTETTLTSLEIVGPMNSDDINAIDALPYLTSLDLSSATIVNWDMVFPTNGNNSYNNGTNYLKQNLETIKFPKTSVTEIPSYCMKEYNIKKVTIPVGYKKIGEWAFGNCPKLQLIKIPEGVTEICANAFNHAAIQSVRLPNSLTKIGASAFVDCFSLTSVTIPANVTEIGSSAFNNCKSLKDIYVLNTTQAPTLGSDAFDIMMMHYNGGGYPYTNDDYSKLTDEQKKAISVNRDTYWTGTSKFSMLHFPKGCESIYTDVDRKSSYVLKGTDGIKYPTRDQGEAVYDNNTGWKKFVLSGVYDVTPAPNIVADRWYTMCFDFNMTKAQIESAFGPGTEVCRFQGVRYVKATNGDLTATLDFSKDKYKVDTPAETTITTAGYPYMIHPAVGDPDNDPIVYYISGVVKVDNGQVYGDNGEVFDNATSVKGYYPKDSYTFIGNLGADTTVPVGNYYLGLPKVNNDGTEDGWRRYFYNKTATDLTWKKYVATLQESGTVNYHASNPTAGAKTCVAFGNDAVIFTSDNSTTGIENTESENSNETSVKFADKVFSISGQLVRTGSSSLDGLAKGMYIVNGKKYIVK